MKSKLKTIGSVSALVALGMAFGYQQAVAKAVVPQTKAAAPTAKAVPLSNPAPSVNMTQSCSSPTAALGASVTYTVNLNISGGACTGAQVQDVLPAGMSYVRGTATTLGGGTFTCTGQTLTWVMSTVGPCTCTMSYVAQVNNLLGLAGSILQNTAVLTCSQLSSAVSATASLAISALNTNTPTNTPVPPTATKTFAPPPPTLTPTSTYTCMVPTATYTPTFTCVPPTATPTPTFTFTCVPPTATYSFTPTNSFTPVPTNTFTPVPTNTFTSTYSSTPTNTHTPTNSFTPTNTLSPTNTPTPLPTVNLLQTASSLTAALGGSVTYTINLAVSGCAATNTQVQDILPVGLSYVQGTATSLQGATFTCTGSTLTWVMNSVGPCTCTMSYVAKVDNVLGLVGSTLGNTSVMTCPWLSGSLSSTANVNITGLLGLGL